jgi:hypothetical protein
MYFPWCLRDTYCPAILAHKSLFATASSALRTRLTLRLTLRLLVLGAALLSSTKSLHAFFLNVVLSFHEFLRVIHQLEINVRDFCQFRLRLLEGGAVGFAFLVLAVGIAANSIGVLVLVLA